MPATTPDAPLPRRRRMSPEDRRLEILEAARKLFSGRPYSNVSTGDIAEAAGVARSLVHHYFGGIREVFFAVIAQSGAAMSDVREAGPETPFAERTARNVAASLDVVAENRESWMAVFAHGMDPTDPQIHALVVAAKERGIDRILIANRDIVQDTPTARFVLRCFAEMTIEATHAWVRGDRTREETEALLLTVGRDLLQHSIPTLELRSSAP